jgi:phytanoyl-CoA hydroxylase
MIASGFDVASYRRDGYAVLPGFKSPDEITRLRQRAAEIVRDFDVSRAGVFTTRDQPQNSDAYFLESGDKIRCFLEEDGKTVNKIGHAMHDLDPVFDAFSRDARLAEIARQIGIAEPLLYQSMYIFKQPRVGGEVRWHQDASFFFTDPPSVTAFWFALDDASVDNGCLWVQPGGHRSPLRQRFTVCGGAAHLETIDLMPWPDTGDAVPVEVRSGTLVVFDGLLPHYSATNRSEKSRHAYTLHVIDGAARYAPENWLQRTSALPARGF